MRSPLFVPGDSERKIERAASSAADAFIVDLEDAVAASRKDAARDLLVTARAALAGRRMFVRVNGSGSGRAAEDLAAAVDAGADGVMLPKVTGADDVTGAHVTGTALPVIALVELAAAVVHAGAIAAAPCVERLALGTEDLAADLGLSASEPSGRDVMVDVVRAQLVLAARAAGSSAPLDGPYLDVRDLAGFELHCRRARGMGFGGVLCLHPDQVAVANEVFRPTAAEVDRARKVVEAFDAAERQGSAALLVDDGFVDYAVVLAARSLLDRLAAIERLEADR